MSNQPQQESPILILGAGINGIAIARQLLINAVPVVIVDRQDLCFGATSYSSRLIHGGLRYLEYAEIGLVRESLAERTRLLNIAPQFVQPLKLVIPSESQWSGILSSAAKFLRLPLPSARKPRGAMLVRCGLWAYDRLARSSNLPPHQTEEIGSSDIPPICSNRYRWAASYHDAQVAFPERLCVGMLQDCAELAKSHGVEFRLLTYHEAQRDGDRITLRDLLSENPNTTIGVLPRALINATGSFVDRTLQRIDVPSDRLMGGTKGSHLFTANTPLREALGGSGIYAEAHDGRPVFVLPLAEGVLIGTTDIFFDDDPAVAVASADEIDYLVDVVRTLFPQIDFSSSDVLFHYCGVRPLPARAPGQSAASVTRSHVLHKHDDAPWPMISVIGGKLTTCRSLAEEVAQWVSDVFSLGPLRSGETRPIPGHGNVAAMVAVDERGYVPGTRIPTAVVRQVIKSEHVRTLEDLVLRRLMLLYEKDISRKTLLNLASTMVELGVLSSEQLPAAVQQCQQRLGQMHGRKLSQ